MSGKFWSGYWKSLKPLEVEEPIDVWVHRPLAYLIARVALRTPISPNAITGLSVLLGIASLALLLLGHLPWAGLMVFLSAVFDCADGQLARMRGSSSPFGRMLDGFADLVVSVATVGGGTYLVWLKYSSSWQVGLGALVVCAATATTSSFHTTMYDHYKNLFLRMTNDRYQEGEDLSVAEERYRAGREGHSPFLSVAWGVYLFYLRSQADFSRWFDPALANRWAELPPYDEQHARAYRAHAGNAMRIWRSFFGFGSMVFGLAVSIAFNIVDWYILARLVLLNAVFFFYLRPMQRRASKAVIQELRLPEVSATSL